MLQAFGQGRRYFLLFALLVPPAALFPLPAAAQFHVVQPDVVKGQGQVADHAAVYSGPGSEERLVQGHDVELTYGLSERLAFLTMGLFQEPIGGPLEAQDYNIGGQIEFIKRHGDGLGLAFRSLYKFALQGGEPDKVLFGPIGRIVSGRNSATIDTFFVRDLGGGDSVALDIKWQLRRGIGERVSLGIEGYGTISDLAAPGTFAEQEHRLGPVLYLKLGPWTAKEVRDSAGVGEEEIFGFSIGALFGLTEATSDVAFKFNLSGVF
jgi:hypothetical protein